MAASDSLSPQQFPRAKLYDVYSHEYGAHVSDLVGSKELQSMTDDIRENGVKEPIHLHENDLGWNPLSEDWRKAYSMQDGHHRVVSAIAARVPTVPVIIHRRSSDSDG